MKLFFSYDENQGFRYHNTEEAAKSRAEGYLESYSEDASTEGWSDEVDSVCWGEVTQSATKVNVHSPDPEKGESTEFDEICDYVLLPELVGPDNADVRNKHLDAVGIELARAKAKHPFFAHRAMDSLDEGFAKSLLLMSRGALKERIDIGDVSGDNVILCELAEAREAFSRKDYAACIIELSHVAAVAVRMMEAVEAEAKGGEA